MPHISTSQRYRILVTGIVQGVGFRPFVHKLAHAHGLSGFVRNQSGTVCIEVEGTQAALDVFLDDLKRKSPPLSRIDALVLTTMQLQGSDLFEIYDSTSEQPSTKFVPADAATCSDCLYEIFNPSDRRYRYPFTNCTNCGPRFTIIDSLPYDREATTMSKFKMCRLCLDEYLDPANRRFHAQPNACPACGPSLRFYRSESGQKSDVKVGDDALLAVLEALQSGQIAAIKGLGGFHLVCDARNEKSIAILRQRKRRKAKPFAVMMSDMAMLRRYCDPSAEEEALLCSSSKPIVLLKRNGDHLPLSLAPDSNEIGIVLAYTPLHHLLLADFSSPIVATSANLSEEPIAIENDEAFQRLMKVADCFLDHNRDIFSRYDDSVLKVCGARRSFVRRSRGFAPDPIKLPFSATQSVLALGAHLKSTFTIIQDNFAYPSQHIGDLENFETSEYYRQSLETYTKLFDFSPDIIAHDLHPDYFSTSLAEEFQANQKMPLVPVQHHHAHIVSCMVEHHLSSPVIGVAFDGIGYGADGTLWGGEFLLCELSNFKRLAHFEQILLPGSSKAIKEPWRIVLGMLDEMTDAQRDSFQPFLESLEDRIGIQALSLLRQQIKARINCPLTSSCGRLFDAISALLGICMEIDYEGQAAVRLESSANACSHFDLNECLRQSYSFTISPVEPLIVHSQELFIEAYADMRRGMTISNIACKFHSTVARIISETCCQLRESTMLDKVCLSGGVFQNQILKAMSERLLFQNSFETFFPEKLPANDGGISLGQAVIALAKLNALEQI